MNPAYCRLLTLFVLASPALRSSAQELAPSSPFLPSGAPASAVGAQGSHELVGIIATSSQTLVGITDSSTRRSVWVPVGKTVEGIEVVSCDPKQDRAVIRVGGETKTLALKAASVASGPGTAAASPRPTPALAGPGPTYVKPPAEAEAEREARMLVSDLMEIGMQQRKAYEEAQRKAAEKKAAAKASGK